MAAKIFGAVTNLPIMEKFIQPEQELYTESKTDETLGSFSHVEINSKDSTIAASSNAPAPKIRKNPEV